MSDCDLIYIASLNICHTFMYEIKNNIGINKQVKQ
jgi:hypothetical protein